MKVKICGVTRLDDARRVADLGADFIGFIFVPESPRCIDFDTAAAIAAQVRGPQFVGVFRDAPLARMQDAPVDLIQLHGDEPDGVIGALDKPVIRAFGLRRQSRRFESGGLAAALRDRDWLLFDSPGGGTGQTFDWSLLADYPRTHPFFLAGGLTPDNVAQAISTVRPDGIDVSSGVESSPGIKDPVKLELLFKRVK